MEAVEIQQLVQMIKAEMFVPSTSSLINSTSAYETAWVAMVPHPDDPDRPMFPEYLDWMLSNQREGEFWGVPDRHHRPTLGCITDTLACIFALDSWKVGTQNIEQANQQLEWFAIIFPGMLELAQAKGLEILPDSYSDMVNHVFLKRERILERMSSSSLGTILLLEMYFEVLPASYRMKNQSTIKLSGLTFLSPSATAGAYMATGDEGCLDYLKTMLHNYKHGAPSVCPINEDLKNLCLVDHLERLGCGEHFIKEIGDVIHHAYSNWVMEEQRFSTKHDAWFQMYKDLLSFRLLRMHGYSVSPRRFCWFLNDEKLLLHIEENYSYYLGAMYNIYRASHVLFPQEEDLENAKKFSRKILQKGLSSCSDRLRDHDTTSLTNFQIEIECELGLSWLARLDHLEHRKYIERNEDYVLWLGKTSSCRLSFPNYILRLAKKNFMMRQSTYKAELEELKRWSRNTSLSNMGFRRETTTHCYFAVATTSCISLTSDLRMMIAKCSILATVADDFFDEEGSKEELYSLMEAVERWNGEGLSGHGKTIFDALDDLVTDIASKSFNRYGYHIKKILEEMWIETFESWMKESEWSRSKQAPSMKEYLKVGMISIAIQAMILPSLYLIGPKLADYSINSPYKPITKLLMVSARLLNDTRTYQKEAEIGKPNMVLLYLKENPKEQIEDSIVYVKNIVNKNDKELLALVLGDEHGDMPKEWKELHLSTLKAFWMLYNSNNLLDSHSGLLQDVNLAFYHPLDMDAHNLQEVAPPEGLVHC